MSLFFCCIMFLVLVYIVYPGLGQPKIIIEMEDKFLCITLATHRPRRICLPCFVNDFHRGGNNGMSTDGNGGIDNEIS